MPIFESETVKNLLNKNALFVQVGGSSGKDVAHFANKFKKNTFIYTDISLGAVRYASKKYGHNTNITFKQSNAIEIANKLKDDFESYSKIIILFKGSANYLNSKEINLFFDQFLKVDKDVFIFLCDTVLMNNKKLDVVAGSMRYMSFSHDYKKICEAKKFDVLKWKLFHSPETDQLQSNVYGVFLRKAIVS